jgi:hypothetical protein
VLQSLYNLSDEQVEYHVRVEDSIPDGTTLFAPLT